MSIVIKPHHHCSGEIFAVFLDGLHFFFFFNLGWEMGELFKKKRKEKRKLKVKKNVNKKFPLVWKWARLKAC